MSAVLDVLWTVCAVVGGWFLVSVGLVLLWIWANERARRRHGERRDAATARNLSGWR